MPTALACNSRDICFFPRVNKLDFRCMLLEIVVENGTQTFGEGEDEREEDDDGGDDGDDDSDEDEDEDEGEDDDDEDGDSDNSGDEADIGRKRPQAILNSGDEQSHFKVPVRPWIEEEDDVSHWRAPVVKRARATAITARTSRATFIYRFCHHEDLH